MNGVKEANLLPLSVSPSDIASLVTIEAELERIKSARAQLSKREAKLIVQLKRIKEKINKS